jgi:hypothetical protein
MATAQKKIFELPLKFVFTEEGSSVLMKQQVKFNRLKMGDKTEEYGVSLEKVTPAFLQRMLMAGYISKIEVSGIEVVSSRKELIDLSKLIVFSILYDHYNHVSKTQILAAEPIKKWNHLNPFSVIDEKTQFPEGSADKYLKEHEAEISAIRGDLLKPVNENITKDETISPDEKNIRLLMAEKLLGYADPLIWVVLLKFHAATDYYFLLMNVRNCLVEYLRKSTIADYTALMILELAQNMENINILKEAQILYKNKYVKLFKILQEPQFRLPVIKSLREKNTLVTLAWKIGGTSLSIGTRGRFQVVLYDKELNYREIRDSFEATKAMDITKNSITEFYHRLQESGNDLELGMYYLSYLSEACEKVGVKFESMVNQVPLSDLTMTTLSFAL